eukprot:gnl/TRDRNA2_/TRDRNA2_169779_c3_seq2.p1 gnl/TRDRNA2_/TRDRNA2_169779_c3~~gnl/TRDRNA2_/TRDRNA2_169779_c3_seq2.p1  ORF type:complete len:206 (+),score=21.79 gnl/TRDRNA2_/TRDRNA2_169779_c3_seq2:95-712(+)
MDMLSAPRSGLGLDLWDASEPRKEAGIVVELNFHGQWLRGLEVPSKRSGLVAIQFFVSGQILRKHCNPRSKSIRFLTKDLVQLQMKEDERSAQRTMPDSEEIDPQGVWHDDYGYIEPAVRIDHDGTRWITPHPSASAHPADGWVWFTPHHRQDERKSYAEAHDNPRSALKRSGNHGREKMAAEKARAKAERLAAEVEWDQGRRQY